MQNPIRLGTRPVFCQQNNEHKREQWNIPRQIKRLLVPRHTSPLTRKIRAVKQIFFLRPRKSFKLATMNVRTLRQPEQQIALVRSLEHHKVDICCLSETRLYDATQVARLSSPSQNAPGYTLRCSGDDDAKSKGISGVGIALSKEAESAVVSWIPVSSRLCAIRLSGSVRK